MIQLISTKYRRKIAFFLLSLFYLSVALPSYGGGGGLNFRNAGSRAKVSLNGRSGNTKTLLPSRKQQPEVKPFVPPHVFIPHKKFIGGPSQPEMSSFKPVSMDNMVNLFTGDFSYNIPLLDVGGYPVNLFYNGNNGPEQEASWVGLGWNINPGSITRNMRGIPDDFNGDDVLLEENTMKPNRTWGARYGDDFEVAGIKKRLPVLGKIGVSFNNYLGPAIELNLKGSIGFKIPASAGAEKSVNEDALVKLQLNATLDSRNGLTFSPQASLLATAFHRDKELNFGFGASTSYNSRYGIKELQLNEQMYFNAHVAINPIVNNRINQYSTAGILGHLSSTISFAKPSYIPTLRMPVTHSAYAGHLQWGGGINSFYGSHELEVYFQRSAVADEDVTLYYTKGSYNGYVRLNTDVTINKGISDAMKGSILYTGSNSLLQQANTSLFYDSSRQSIGLGTSLPAAVAHALSVATQLRTSYDINNYVTTTVTSAGGVQFSPAGTSPGFVIPVPIMSGTNAYANLWLTSATSAVASTDNPWQFAGSPGTFVRFSAGSGSTSTTLTAGYNYSGINFGDQLFTEAASGSHRVIANTVTGSLTGAAGSAASKYLTSLYIKKPLSADNAVIPDSASYSFWAESAPRIDVGGDTTGDLLYRSSNGALTRTATISNNQVLGIVNGAPAWLLSNRVMDTLWTIKDTLYYTKGSYNGRLTLAIRTGGHKQLQGAADSIAIWRGDTLKSFSVSLLPGIQAPAVGNNLPGATNGSVLYSGTKGVLQQNNAALYFDSTVQNFGVGTNSPVSKIHSLSTGEQLRLSYDTSNYASFTVSSTGQLSMGATGSFSSLLIGSTLYMNANGGNGNFLIHYPAKISAMSGAQWLYGGASVTSCRASIGRGSTSGNLPNGNCYAGLILPIQKVAEAYNEGDVNRIMSSMVINGLATTNAAATTSYMNGLYIANPLATGNGVTPDSASYSLWTETAPRFDAGNDAAGDIYYRNSNGALTRLGAGSANQVLSVLNGVPTWSSIDNTGSVTMSGDGNTKSFTIVHGLGKTPVYWKVVPTNSASAGITYVTADATYITFNYVSPPASGTNNLSYVWRVK